MHKKKSYRQEMSVRSIPIFPAHLATFEESWIFGHPKRPFWTPAAPKCDMIGTKWNFRHNFFTTLRIFYVKMATSLDKWIFRELFGHL